MSITMHLFYTGKDGSARRFAEEMEHSGTADRIRAEDGNEGYAYYLPMNDPETVLLIDSWRDQTALDAHHASLLCGRSTSCICGRSGMFLTLTASRYRIVSS